MDSPECGFTIANIQNLYIPHLNCNFRPIWSDLGQAGCPMGHSGKKGTN
jgi:hypothetical protein